MDSPFLAQIQLFGFQFAPRGWMLCQGQILSIAQNTALFSLLGTTYGGNGQTTFALPDLRGRVAIGQGQGPGLSDYIIGELAGTENTTLTIAQMPMHNHPFTGGGASASSGAGTESVCGTGGATTLAVGSDADTRAAINLYNSTTPDVVLNSGASRGQVGISGGSQPFSILQPFLTLNYSIATSGIFPSRN